MQALFPFDRRHEELPSYLVEPFAMGNLSMSRNLSSCPSYCHAYKSFADLMTPLSSTFSEEKTSVIYTMPLSTLISPFDYTILSVSGIPCFEQHENDITGENEQHYLEPWGVLTGLHLPGSGIPKSSPEVSVSSSAKNSRKSKSDSKNALDFVRHDPGGRKKRTATPGGYNSAQLPPVLNRWIRSPERHARINPAFSCGSTRMTDLAPEPTLSIKGRNACPACATPALCESTSSVPSRAASGGDSTCDLNLIPSCLRPSTSACPPRTVDFPLPLGPTSASDYPSDRLDFLFKDILSSLGTTKRYYGMEIPGTLFPRDPSVPFHQLHLVGDIMSKMRIREGINHPMIYFGHYGTAFTIQEENVSLPLSDTRVTWLSCGNKPDTVGVVILHQLLSCWMGKGLPWGFSRGRL